MKTRRVMNPMGSPHKARKATVQQSMMQRSDINYIVAQAKRGIAPVNTREDGQYLDVSDTPQTLMEAYERIERAETAFMSLPVRARDELDNDPTKLLMADREFFDRHGLVESEIRPLATSPEVYGEAEGGTPSMKKNSSSKGSMKEPKATDV